MPEKINSVEQLEELLSRPTPEVVEMVSRVEGDFMVLGVGGKIGPSLAHMIRRACEQAGVQKKIIGVARFSSPGLKEQLAAKGIETIQGNLLNTAFLRNLPQVKNVLFLAGMKFGTQENLARTWAVNSYLPALVAEKFRRSRIVAFSTGCVYELVSPESGGSLETDVPGPIGEYAQSCLGRERMFEYGSQKYQTPGVLIRLNYAVELRYGVLVDIALAVKDSQPIDLTMGYFNVIWQGDANALVLRTFEICETPPRILNVTGSEILSVRQVANKFGKYFKKAPWFRGKEAETALLSNTKNTNNLFGQPKVSPGQMITWIADWIIHDRALLNKPTHFQVRDGKY